MNKSVLDEAVLKRQGEDQNFSKDASRSYTLPARFYTDASIYELEKESIFYRTWHYAGHVSQVSEPRSYFTTRIHNQNLFVARGTDDKLRAFYNVCAHRGHELLQGAGKKNVITCPYHAWAFNFDGSLLSARNSENVAGFDRSQFSLKEVQLEEFCGLLLVNLDQDAESFASQFDGLEAEIRQYLPSVDTLAMAQRDTYEVDANWKVLIDNFLECYHCAPAHQDFVDLVDMQSYRTITHKRYSSQCAAAPRTNKSKAFHFEAGDVDLAMQGSSSGRTSPSGSIQVRPIFQYCR